MLPVTAIGSDGSKTQLRRRQVPFVELLSLICHRFPENSKMQCTLDTEASCESVTWIVFPSPRPRVQTLSNRTIFSPMRGPEMKSNSSGATGMQVPDCIFMGRSVADAQLQSLEAALIHPRDFRTVNSSAWMSSSESSSPPLPVLDIEDGEVSEKHTFGFGLGHMPLWRSSSIFSE